jgi:type VI protein secretion system component VasK
MKKLLAIVLQPPIPQIVGLLLLSAIIYFGGNALRAWHGLGSGTLLLLVGVVWLLAVLVFVWRRWRSAKRARMIEDRLRGQAREHIESIRPDKRSQVEELEQQLATAITTLKNSKLGKGALYELPWYVIIGPPGSGKTTLLRESNLSFPDQTHGRGVRGVGGTRNCDWWFTDQGILLDTAGRYTTQDEDKGEWLQFLSMLKKSRARKPINGAIIAISIADIATGSDEQLAEHARKVRERLAELTQKLEVVFPVYLLFSKCDLLDGFVETFGGYGQKERAQTWGFTMPYLHTGDGDLAQRFDREFDDLMARLSVERLQTLGAARSQAKKAKIFSFPLQFAGVRDRVRAFLTQLQQANPYHESSDLRGVFFTSGTQEGQPFDQVLAGMREACGLELDPDTGSDEEVDKKAYFIDELFTDVVFGDKELARSSAAAEKRRTTIRRAGLFGSIAATVALCVWIVVAYTGHSSLIERSIAAYTAADREFTADDFADEERLAKGTGGAFDQLRKVFVELDESYGSVGSYLMGQGNNLYDRRIRPRYVEHVFDTFVRPLQDRHAESLQRAIDDAGEGRDAAGLKDELMAYSMLGGRLTIDREWLEGYLIGSRWTWTPGKQIEACRVHRQAFLERIAEPGYSDWTYLPREEVLQPAEALWLEQDGLRKTVEDLRKRQGLDQAVSAAELLNHPDKELVDKSVSVTQGALRPGAIDEVLDTTAEQRGDGTAAELKSIDRQVAIQQLLRALAEFRPAQKANLREANEVLLQLTTNPESGVYAEHFENIRARLESLGVDCPAGDNAWLVETVKEIGTLHEPIQALTTRPRLQRIVADATSDKQVELIVAEMLRIAEVIRKRTKEAPDAIRSQSLQLLSNLLGSVQDALAGEIISETNTTWRNGVGDRLREFSMRFPFTPDADDSVDPGAFDEVFAKGTGAFDQAMEWIRFLEGQLTMLQRGRPTKEHKADRRKVEAIQRALFSGAETGCDIDFVLMPLGDASAVHFLLGRNEPLIARRKVEKTFAWVPAADAAIEIKGFSMQGNDKGVDAAFECDGNWGFIRMLSVGKRGEGTGRYEGFLTCEWDQFLVDGEPLLSSTGRARAALLFKTTAEPNPLEQGFFTHAFTREVFGAR